MGKVIRFYNSSVKVIRVLFGSFFIYFLYEIVFRFSCNFVSLFKKVGNIENLSYTTKGVASIGLDRIFYLLMVKRWKCMKFLNIIFFYLYKIWVQLCTIFRFSQQISTKYILWRNIPFSVTFFHNWQIPNRLPNLHSLSLSKSSPIGANIWTSLLTFIIVNH